MEWDWRAAKNKVPNNKPEQTTRPKSFHLLLFLDALVLHGLQVIRWHRVRSSASLYLSTPAEWWTRHGCHSHRIRKRAPLVYIYIYIYIVTIYRLRVCWQSPLPFYLEHPECRLDSCPLLNHSYSSYSRIACVPGAMKWQQFSESQLIYWISKI